MLVGQVISRFSTGQIYFQVDSVVLVRIDNMDFVALVLTTSQRRTEETQTERETLSMEEMTGQWKNPVFCNLIIEVVSFLFDCILFLKHNFLCSASSQCRFLRW